VAGRREKPVQPKAEQEKPAQQVDRPAATSRPADNQLKKEFRKPDNRNNTHYNNRPPKKDEPARPVDDDMLRMLSDKFKKG
jgi:DNA polymerase-3 subunit epsilon